MVCGFIMRFGVHGAAIAWILDLPQVVSSPTATGTVVFTRLSSAVHLAKQSKRVSRHWQCGLGLLYCEQLWRRFMGRRFACTASGLIAEGFKSRRSVQVRGGWACPV
jgi:hypothetical protein